MNTNSANYAVTAVNADSDLVTLADQGVAGADATSTSGLITDAIVAALDDSTRRLAVSVDAAPPIEFDLFDPGQGGGAVVATLGDVADVINDNTLAPGLTIAVVPGPNAGEGRLEATTTSSGRTSSVSFRQAGANSATAVLRWNIVSGAREAEGSAGTRPAQTGTAGARHVDFDPTAVSDGDEIEVQLNDAAGVQIDNATVVTFSPPPASLAEARGVIEAALRTSTIPAISQGTVDVIDNALVIAPGGDNRSRNFTFAAGGGGDAAGPLNLTAAAGAFVNVSMYELGVGPVSNAQAAAQMGDDGTPPGPALIAGSRAAKTGIYALEDVDLFNILVPGVSDVAVLTEAIAYAEERRSMVLIDLDPSINSLDEARDWINDPANSGLKHRNAVAYFPQVRLADRLQNGRLRSFPNSGLMAGLWARTDAQRGVWKAPAGIEARLRGVQALDYVLSDPENGVLNPLGLNCLRTFPVFGTVSWGSRTLVGADAFASEWKYVPVRRIALFIEESLYRGTQFVVFEPNDEPLWAQIRLSVGSFMNNLFRQGAFQGATPEEAFFVRCDSTTTIQADIDLGIVNIHVGFAPLKPAEFVVIHIQQIAGQSQA
ncbi:phage tail sheath family protein [Rhodobacteraceae bacterium B1Z28]|uniref:Phage tail sheath family protein n=2 Tax=Ruegeria haliotis TaxID=2747601 RepID=A0ABX2PVR9_9RHOB|nr:phage tail sheath family protein [Ruegeria haliotis]